MAKASFFSRHRILLVGLLLIVASGALLFNANSKAAKCESITGKIVQLLDSEKQEGCAQVKTMQFFSYAGIALGIGFLVIHFVRKE
jgi:hypothetical protein